MAGVHYKLTLDQHDIARIGLSEAQREVTDTGRRVLNRAIVLTPVDTGLLRSRNQMRIKLAGAAATAEVFNDTVYAAAVHDGTRAHTIVPKRAKALRFEIGGEVVFARSVQMPARKGRPWLRRALEEIAKPLGYRITD